MAQPTQEELQELTRRVNKLISSLPPPTPWWVGVLAFFSCIALGAFGLWLLFALVAFGISSLWAQAICYSFIAFGALGVLWLQRFLARRTHARANG